MNLDYPLPNVVCRCGTLLFSWEEVMEHWQNHQCAAHWMRLHQNLMSARLAAAPPQP